MANRIKAWSFSRWNTYQKCPRQAFYRFIQRLPEPEAPPLVRGQRLHSDAERFVKGELSDLPDELTLLADELEDLRDRYAQGEAVYPELGWAFNRKWVPVHEDLDKKEFNPQTWLRVKVDVLDHYADHTARVIDHKTGKIREEEHQKQLDLYAPAAFLKYPSLETVEAELWYLDQGEILSLDYHRSELPDLLARWERDTEAMLTDETFPPNPSYGCKYCPFSSKHGNGPCEVG
jgi:CRISPR/Cas system-associated exonuclease Cas4 (RecB family)